MAKESIVNSYEDARKQTLLENKKRLEDLGLAKLSKSLSDVAKPEKPKQRLVKPKSTSNLLIEPRRSSRPRNQVPSYRDDVAVEPPSLRKKSRLHSSWASYIARPIEEIKTATYEERARAFKYAEKLQSNLQNENPFFVKSMLRSHVYSCFWLGLKSEFCEDYLPKSTTGMVLENEAGKEYNVVYISERTGISGGWRAFALEHKLDDGDACLFELIEPTRFKVYIVRAFDCDDDQEDNLDSTEDMGDAEERPKKKSKKSGKKIDKDKSEKSSKSSKKEIPSGCDDEEDKLDSSEDMGDAEETPKKKTKKSGEKTDNHKSEKSSKSSKKEMPSGRPGTRRSLRNK